jgi:hypothetical protein
LGADEEAILQGVFNSLAELEAKYKTSEELKERRRKITELSDPIVVLEVAGGGY